MSKLSKSLYSILSIYTYSTPRMLKQIFDSDTIQQLEANTFLKAVEDNPDAIYIDLRTSLEYNISHHPRAININYLWGFDSKIRAIDNKKTIFLNCLSAHRSPYAAFQLKKLGFTKIYDLKGGFVKIKGKMNLTKQ